MRGLSEDATPHALCRNRVFSTEPLSRAKPIGLAAPAAPELAKTAGRASITAAGFSRKWHRRCARNSTRQATTACGRRQRGGDGTGELVLDVLIALLAGIERSQ